MDDWVIVTARQAWREYGWRTLLVIPAAVGIVAAAWVVYVVAWAVFS